MHGITTSPHSELILVVNDVEDHAANDVRALIDHGFKVKLVRTGAEAMRFVRASLPQCVVIDLRLPDMPGWELCRRLKQEHATRVIMLTPDVSKMCAADSTKAGCSAWLARPTVADDLALTVRRVLDMTADEPASAADALIGVSECPACGGELVRSTLRVGPVQYYCCQHCRFCWRVEALVTKR